MFIFCYILRKCRANAQIMPSLPVIAWQYDILSVTVTEIEGWHCYFVSLSKNNRRMSSGTYAV